MQDSSVPSQPFFDLLADPAAIHMNGKIAVAGDFAPFGEATSTFSVR